MCSHLRRLSKRHFPFVSFHDLTACPTLQHLDITVEDTQFGLPQCSNLKSLSLEFIYKFENGERVRETSDLQALHVTELRKLERLRIDMGFVEADISQLDEVVKVLGGCRNLKFLELHHCHDHAYLELEDFVEHAWRHEQRDNETFLLCYSARLCSSH